MNKTISAIAVAILIGSMPVAYAHQSHATKPNQAVQSIQPDQIRASKMIGSTVYDVQNRDIGKVRDLILDRSGQVAGVAIDVGTFLGMGGKTVAVKLSDLKMDNNRITLDRTKEQLQQMANLRLENRNTGSGTSASPVHGGKLGSGR